MHFYLFYIGYRLFCQSLSWHRWYEAYILRNLFVIGNNLLFIHTNIEQIGGDELIGVNQSNTTLPMNQSSK